jgi:hypothetical protein
MLKHDTVVLTVPALERLEERILFHMHKADFWQGNTKESKVNRR